MKLALECPTYMLNDVQPLADLDFILTHLVLQDKEYANYYRHSNRTKILDNSVNEIGVPTSLNDILKAATIVQPNFVIPPDFLGNTRETYRTLCEAEVLFPRASLLPVIQGSSLEELRDYTRELVYKGYNYLALPYTILNEKGASLKTMAMARKNVVKAIQSNWPKLELHLLGMTTLEELEDYRYSGEVVSLDTGCPILNGLSNSLFGQSNLIEKNQTGKPEEATLNQISTKPTAVNYSSIYYNIAYLRKLLRKIRGD